MKHRITLAVMAGMLALGTAACERDPAGIATAPAAAPAPRPPVGPQAIIQAPGDSLIPLPDGPTGPYTYFDSEGHRYDITVSNSVARHFRDGVLFADGALAVGSATNVYADGELVQIDESVLRSAPSGARAVGRDAIGAGTETIGFRPGRPGRPGEPMRMMMARCGSEISSYIIASGELILAGMYLQRHRGQRAAITAFTAALANFVAAWRELYYCQGG